MSWFVLLASGAFEAVWVIALSMTEGFSRLKPTLVFTGALIISMAGLGWAMRELSPGTAYAAWAGVGASAAVIYAMATGLEPVSLVKVLLLIGLIGCIVGLRIIG